MFSIKKIVKSILGGNTLYYPGCLSKFASKEIVERCEELLLLSNESFILLSKQEFCCGSPVLNAGYEQDYQDLVEKNKKVFADYSVEKIITSCPSCYHVFSNYGFENIEVEYITTTILRALETGKLKVKNKVNEDITYHDSCHLGRKSGIYDEPRQILKQLGYNVIEMKHSYENSLCCGGGGGLGSNFKDTSKAILKLRISEAKDIGVKKIITTCPMCFNQLKEGASKDVEVVEFTEALLDAVR